MGNPFPCELIDKIDTLRAEIGERCQFINLEAAYHRAGDHEPVPCCEGCKELCQYACERSTRKREEQIPESQPQERNADPTLCPHREGYDCTVPENRRDIPADGSHCDQSCCWGCRYHGACEMECHASAGRAGERPEFDAAWFVRQWAKRFPDDLEAVMEICKDEINASERAKAIQKYISPYGARCQCCEEYDFYFHEFAGGMDIRIGRVQIHLKYGRFVIELLGLYDPQSAEFDDDESLITTPEERTQVNSEVSQDREEPKPPDENWNIGDLPQAKERYIKGLARLLVEKKGSRLILDAFSNFPSDDTVKKKLEVLGNETDGVIEIADGVIAYACAEVIEFAQGKEDLGVCSYAKFGNQVRKALEEWQEKGMGKSDQNNADTKMMEVVDAEFAEIKEPDAQEEREAPEYDDEVLKEMITQEEEALALMAEQWRQKQPHYYAKHMMALKAYKMLQAEHLKEI